MDGRRGDQHVAEIVEADQQNDGSVAPAFVDHSSAPIQPVAPGQHGDPLDHLLGCVGARQWQDNDASADLLDRIRFRQFDRA